MKFIHTADWHLGLRLGPHELIETQFAQIERILQFCIEHDADALLVAGDVFEKRTNLAAITKRLADLLRPHLERGLHVILMPGNHDDREHFRLMRALLEVDGEAQNRFHVAQQQENFEACGVQWGIMPYPDRDALAQYLQKSGDKSVSAEDRNQAMSSALVNVVDGISKNFDIAKPAVFVGHITIAGITTSSETELSYAQGLNLGRNDLPANAAYIALGHIHQPQQIVGENMVPCFYSGNLDRYNRGERNDPRKGVRLVEIIAEEGVRPRAESTWLDLPVTPFHEITIKADEVEELPTRYPDLERAFVQITLDCAGADASAVATARRRIYELCPRVLDCTPINESADVAAPENFAPRDWRVTTMGYVNERFAERADLEDLQMKTREILEEVENAIKSR